MKAGSFFKQFLLLFSLLNLLSQPLTTREKHSVRPGHSERELGNIIQKEIFDFHFFPRSTFIGFWWWYFMVLDGTWLKNDATCHMWICLYSVLLERHQKGCPHSEPTRNHSGHPRSGPYLMHSTFQENKSAQVQHWNNCVYPAFRCSTYN